MNQPRILLLFRFPEYDSEYFMTYSFDELFEASRDAVNFYDMYPGVLYVKVISVYEDEHEEKIYSWTNPQSAKLQALANSAGLAGNTFPMSSVSAPPAGAFFQRLSKYSSDTRLSLRPPSEEQFVPPLPSVSKTYGGRNRRARRK